SPTAITSATPVTARLPPQRSKSMRGRHDNHQRFEVPATNGSRPIAGGRLCGGKVSELFRTGEWICGRSDRCREALDRLLLFGWLLSQRDPIELSCEGVMTAGSLQAPSMRSLWRAFRHGDASLVGK